LGPVFVRTRGTF